MFTYLLFYNDGRDRNVLLFVSLSPEAAIAEIPGMMACWGDDNIESFSIEIWCTNTGHVGEYPVPSKI